MSAHRDGNAELSITMLNGEVDPSRSGSKAYVEIRLRETVRRFLPVDVDSETGKISYEHTDGIAIKNYDLDEIWDDHVYVVLRFWDPITDWVDAAQIMVPVQSIGIRDECDFRTFVLEPVGDDVFDNEVKPRLVLRATLTSHFRPSVEAVARLLEGYTTTVDRALDVVSEQTDRVVPYLRSRYALVPAIPVGVFILASLPLVMVLAVVGLPLVLPILALAAAMGVLAALVVGAVWAGSRGGRTRIQELARPVIDKLNDDPEVLYPIGPTPSPVRVLRSVLPTTIWPKLALSLIIDFIGCTSYAVPVLGESADLVWAPICFVLLDAMYHHSSPWAGWLGAVEEILPFTDFIPTATLAWLKEFGPVLLDEIREGVAKIGAGGGCGTIDISLDTSREHSS